MMSIANLHLWINGQVAQSQCGRMGDVFNPATGEVIRRVPLASRADIDAAVAVAPETQSGQVLRMRGKGIKGVRSNAPGDLYCHVVVETPVKLSSKQKELLREFESLSQQNNNPKAQSFMDRVKEFFGQ